MNILLRSLLFLTLLVPGPWAQDGRAAPEPTPEALDAPAPDAPGERSPGDDGHAGHRHDVDLDAERTPLEQFRFDNDYVRGVSWFRVELADSLITGTTRRISFDKYAVMEALLTHPGGSGTEAAPIPYESGAVFIAESLDKGGKVIFTAVMRIDTELGNEFFAFDAEGQTAETFTYHVTGADGEAVKRTGAVPESCVACHTGEDYFQPMMSYPYEPEDRALLIDERWRNIEFSERFMEAYHRGGDVFGPYAAIFMGQLKADKNDGLVQEHDAWFLETLALRYFADFDMEPPEFLENPFGDGEGGPPGGEDGHGGSEHDGEHDGEHDHEDEDGGSRR